MRRQTNNTRVAPVEFVRAEIIGGALDGTTIEVPIQVLDVNRLRIMASELTRRRRRATPDRIEDALR